jgi:tetratricopeptide (TPR) repeat protein
LKTTAGSLARFGTLIFEGRGGEPVGRGFLEPATVAEMLTAQPASGGDYGIGYAMREEVPGHRVYGHGGANRGWHATLKLLREERAGLVVLTNGSNGAEVYGQIGNIWLRHRVGAAGLPYGPLSLAVRLLAVHREHGVREALAFYEYLLEEEPGTYGAGERELNRVGIALLDSGAIDDAILVFRRNVADQPHAWNAYDSLGYAYMTRSGDGDVALAIENYEEAVRLNPGNDEGRRYLAELRAR